LTPSASTLHRAHGFDLHSLGRANAWATWGEVTTAGREEMTQGNRNSHKA